MDFENSNLAGSPHHLFAQLVGGWAGVTQTWLEPEGVALQAQTQGSIQLILDGRFAIYIYQSSLDNEPLHGMFTFGYNTDLDRFESSWVDSFHNNTAIMFCVGEPKQNGFSVSGSYPDPAGGPDWGWRTEVTLLAPDHLIITAYNVSPEGAETKAIEAQLRRI